MDVRIFKLLVLLGTEAVLAGGLFIEKHFLGDSRVGNLILHTVSFAMMTFPILIILPEDNWIWLLEEDLRSRKITLRSKAVKHLQLSMLYFMAIGYPIFLITTSLFIWSQWDKYRFHPTWVMGGFGLLFGIFCAFKNYSNVKRYDSLFAVGWDRKSTFLEIFIGVKVTRKMKFFYKGFSLWIGIIFFICSFLATPVYFKFIAPTIVICDRYDREKCMVMQTLFCVLFSISIWIVAMYTTFQFLFTRKLEAWVREKKSPGDSK